MSQREIIKIASIAEVDPAAAARLRALRRAIYIPKESRHVAGSALAGLVGIAAATKLAGRFAGRLVAAAAASE